MKGFKFFTLGVILVLLLGMVPAHAAIQQITPPWERFHQNYHFTASGFDLGRPTTFEGFVPADVFTVNVRRDANVALRPPSYGIGSGYIPTDPFSWLFSQPHTLDYWGNFDGVNLPLITLQQGANSQPTVNFQSVGTGEFLPPTSL